LIDITNRRFGRLVALEPVGRDIDRSVLWRCICDCGTERITSWARIKLEKVKSCGCFSKEMSRLRAVTHNQSNSPTYLSWVAMKARCDNPKHIGFADYGGRGIRYDEKWILFENFLADMGLRPSGAHSIDRIDNNGPYDKSNCRWATRKEQARNKRTSRLITHNEKTLQLYEWSAITGLNPETICARIKRGWPVAEALGEQFDPLLYKNRPTDAPRRRQGRKFTINHNRGRS
jgi:hypothetical protein